MEQVTLDDLMTMSQNLHARAKSTETATNAGFAKLAAVTAELEVADNEALSPELSRIVTSQVIIKGGPTQFEWSSVQCGFTTSSIE